MRRLFALPLIAAAAAIATPSASATDYCTPTVVGACAVYECVDICAPHVGAYAYCNLDSHPRVLACDLINRYGQIVR
jgi:hypothetical protein